MYVMSDMDITQSVSLEYVAVHLYHKAYTVQQFFLIFELKWFNYESKSTFTLKIQYLHSYIKHLFDVKFDRLSHGYI